LVGIATFLLMTGATPGWEAVKTSFRVDNLSCSSCLTNIVADLGRLVAAVDHQSSPAAAEMAAIARRPRAS